MDAVVSSVPELAVCHRHWLERGPGSTDHLVASRTGFVSVRPDERVAQGEATLDAVGRPRALVVDDTFTTGARAQSAVAALRTAGVDVVGVLVVGRVVTPEIGRAHV